MSGKYAGMPSKADIAAFWCSEVSLAECRDRTGWFIDADDSGDGQIPCCFACGWSNAGPMLSDIPKTGKHMNWNNARLDRAHILAVSDGGSNAVTNILLLCPTCHKDAPMTNNREDMFAFIRTREPDVVRETRLYHEALDNIGFVRPIGLQILHESGKFTELMRKAIDSMSIGHHFGSRWSYATKALITAKMLDILLDEYEVEQKLPPRRQLNLFSSPSVYSYPKVIQSQHEVWISPA